MNNDSLSSLLNDLVHQLQSLIPPAVRSRRQRRATPVELTMGDPRAREYLEGVEADLRSLVRNLPSQRPPGEE